MRAPLLPVATVTATVAAAALLGTAAPAGATPSATTTVSVTTGAAGASLICIPEAPVCYGITGTAPNYRYSFHLNPAPRSPSYTFSVDGAPATGTLTLTVGSTDVSGDFTPKTPLKVGNVVCMALYPFVGTPYCATVR